MRKGLLGGSERRVLVFVVTSNDSTMIYSMADRGIQARRGYMKTVPRAPESYVLVFAFLKLFICTRSRTSRVTISFIAFGDILVDVVEVHRSFDGDRDLCTRRLFGTLFSLVRWETRDERALAAGQEDGKLVFIVIWSRESSAPLNGVSCVEGDKE